MGRGPQTPTARRPLSGAGAARRRPEEAGSSGTGVLAGHEGSRQDLGGGCAVLAITGDRSQPLLGTLHRCPIIAPETLSNPRTGPQALFCCLREEVRLAPHCPGCGALSRPAPPPPFSTGRGEGAERGPLAPPPPPHPEQGSSGLQWGRGRGRGSCAGVGSLGAELVRCFLDGLRRRGLCWQGRQARATTGEVCPALGSRQQRPPFRPLWGSNLLVRGFWASRGQVLVCGAKRPIWRGCLPPRCTASGNHSPHRTLLRGPASCWHWRLCGPVLWSFLLGSHLPLGPLTAGTLPHCLAPWVRGLGVLITQAWGLIALGLSGSPWLPGPPPPAS